MVLGGRIEPKSTSTLTWLLRVWLPVVLMVVVIAIESTPTFGANNTTHWFRAGYEFLFGRVDDLQWMSIHHDLRKTGHFVGYGLVGVAWLRAWLMTWLVWMQKRPAHVWRGYAALMAVLCTMLVAACDELHQSYLPNRTGVPQDVLLDTAGAVSLIAFLATFWMRRPWQTSVEG